MTRKDYQLIAEVVANTRNKYPENEGLSVLVGVLGSRLKGDNARFDFQKFMKACGY